MRKYLIGSDPEVFVEDNDGTFINAFSFLEQGLIEGTKRRPQPTPYGAIQVDGMAIEFNTNPTDDSAEFSRLVMEGLQDVSTRFNKRCSTASVKHMDIDWIERQHPLSTEFGCDPDYNAWRNGVANCMAEPDKPFRTAGGHVHIGWGKNLQPFDLEHMRACMEAVKQMDYVLGLWSLAEDKNGAERRKLYGQAGAFRPKSYGVEYRVLSNFWVFDSLLAKQVADRTFAGMRAMDDGRWYSGLKEFGNFAEQEIAKGVLSSKGRDVLEEINTDLEQYM